MRRPGKAAVGERTWVCPCRRRAASAGEIGPTGARCGVTAVEVKFSFVGAAAASPSGAGAAATGAGTWAMDGGATCGVTGAAATGAVSTTLAGAATVGKGAGVDATGAGGWGAATGGTVGLAATGACSAMRDGSSLGAGGAGGLVLTVLTGMAAGAGTTSSVIGLGWASSRSCGCCPPRNPSASHHS